MLKSQAKGDSSSRSPSPRSADHNSLRRCMEWRHNVEPTCPSDREMENLCTTDTQQENITTSAEPMHINPKVSRAINSMKTFQEAQDFLGVAHSIRAERAAELAVLEQQLEQCRQEIRILESNMMAAQGRVVDADRGIAAMRHLMLEKGILLDKDKEF
ncbi:hypothetical protein AX14_011982 [Amanita brunnescens Koide BX004]|nr:hypothetical protein AX14_011982 [Amanita brunnescens Koide BX004]